MKIRRLRFNLYLCAALAVMAALATGCHTEAYKRKHQATALSIHVEVPPDGTNLSEPVPIYRQQPVMVNVDKNAVLSEVNVADAKVVDVVGGFAIRLQFDRQGTWIFEERSIDSRGRRFAIYCEFGPELSEKRWLAAPIVSQRITDGTLIFTPDATRAEADEIVLGLNNVARLVKKKRW
jgi:preprotein translocase subunit SecD